MGTPQWYTRISDISCPSLFYRWRQCLLWSNQGEDRLNNIMLSQIGTMATLIILQTTGDCHFCMAYNHWLTFNSPEYFPYEYPKSRPYVYCIIQCVSYSVYLELSCKIISLLQVIHVDCLCKPVLISTTMTVKQKTLKENSLLCGWHLKKGRWLKLTNKNDHYMYVCMYVCISLFQ